MEQHTPACMRSRAACCTRIPRHAAPNGVKPARGSCALRGRGCSPRRGSTALAASRGAGALQPLDAACAACSQDSAQDKLERRDQGLIGSRRNCSLLLEDEYMAALLKAEVAWLRAVIAELTSGELKFSSLAELRKLGALPGGPSFAAAGCGEESAAEATGRVVRADVRSARAGDAVDPAVRVRFAQAEPAAHGCGNVTRGRRSALAWRKPAQLGTRLGYAAP